MKKTFNILAFLFAFLITAIIVLIVYSKSPVRDVFTTERISFLDNRPKNITHDIVVDAIFIMEKGGIMTLSENLIEKIAKKKPNWRFILLIHPKNTDFNISLPNVLQTRVNISYSEIGDCFFKFINTITFGCFRNKLLQLCFFDRMFIDKKCDLFWNPDGSSYFTLNFPIPIISTIHDVIWFDLDQNGLITSKQSSFQTRISKAITHSKKIITVSEFSKKRILEKFNVQDDFVKAIHIKLGTRVLQKTSSEFDAKIIDKYGLLTKKYLVFLSSFWKHKNHKNLIKAFAKFLNNTKSDVQLVIIGKHSPLKDFKILTDSLQISERVIFTGFVDNKELCVLLKHALAFVHPSVYEGFGMPVIEAMAAGIPVICSNAASLPEIAGDAALLFNPYDTDDIANAMAKIVADEQLRAKLIKSGYKQAKKFEDTDSMIDEYIKTFEEVMKR